MQYLHVKNLEKYHPKFKDRELSWCKLYFTTLNTDTKFMLLHEVDRWRFFAFVMLELQIKRPVPIEPRFLTMKGFDLRRRPISLTLQALHELAEVRDILVSSRYQDGILDKDKDKDKEKEKEGELTHTRTPKNLIIVENYFVELGSNKAEGQKFFDYFTSNGWRIGGKTPMKDWRAAARNWVRRNAGGSKNKTIKGKQELIDDANQIMEEIS